MDLDSFFVSVERLKNPDLIGKPVIICGSSKRGVVSSCSYEARAFGVHSAMPGFKAHQICPQGFFISSDFAQYSKYSKIVTNIIASRVPLFEKASIDEFYIDLSGMDKYFGCYEFAQTLRREITEKTGLPISFGLAANKVVAKMATNKAKPNGHLLIEHGQEHFFLDPLSIENIPMLGKRTTQFLQSRNIKTIKQLRDVGLDQLNEWLGKHGTSLWQKANGKGSAYINPKRDRKSISKEHTFREDIGEVEYLLSVLHQMAEQLCHTLRLENKKATNFAIKLRTPNFETTSLQTTIQPTNFEHEIIPQLSQFFKRIYHKKPLRLIGLRFAGLSDVAYQASIFDNVEKQSKLYNSIDELKKKFGKSKLNRGTSTFNTAYRERRKDK